jgi:hypothetical protein
MYGEIEYDENGKPVCEICGKAFHRVISHIRQKHDMSEREYKLKYGFDLGKGICSLESSEKTRQKTLDNFDLVIGQNLIKGGQNSRFQKGDKGRTRDQISEQTRKMLVSRFSSPDFVTYRKEIGKKLGLTGSGNKARWQNM